MNWMKIKKTGKQICFPVFFVDFNFKEFIQPNQAIITNLSRDLRLSKSPILSLSDHISIPFVTGLWNTKLFLPLSFNLSDDTNYLIIKHELAHLKHHDNLFKLNFISDF